MLRVKSYIAPPESFAPYRYVLKHTQNLNERYVVLAKEIGSQDFMETPEFGSVCVTLCWNKSGRKSLDIKEIVSERAFAATKSSTASTISCFKSYVEEILREKKASTIIVILSRDCDAVEEMKYCLHMDVIFMIIDEEKRKKGFKSPKGLERIAFFTRKDKINSDIGDLLESKVLKTLKDKCEILSKWLAEKKDLELKENATTHPAEGNRKRKTFYVSSKITSTQSKRLSCYSVDSSDSSEGFRETRESKYYVPSTSKPSVKWVSRDTIERLLTEMLALYSTSSVPAQERPNITDYHSRPIDKEMQTEILNLDPTVKGIGYRFTMLVINIEERSSQECRSVKKKIETYLRTNDIDEFTIEVTKEVKPYEVRVGSAIMNTRTQTSSTAGCFAICQNEKCVLVAKHSVPTDVCTFSYCPGNGKANRPLGKVIKETRPDAGLDIAALKLENDVEICAKFRTEDDEKNVELLQGKLYRYFEDQAPKDRGILRAGQVVYIWGAVSKPGKGVVTMCKYKSDQMKALIQIEDRRPGHGELPKQFCQPGDSGSIICVEDRSGQFVHLLGMLMGELIDKNGDKKNADCGKKYLAVPLSSGLQELEERTGHRFEILECTN